MKKVTNYFLKEVVSWGSYSNPVGFCGRSCPYPSLDGIPVIVEEQIERAAQTEPVYSLEEIVTMPAERFPNATPEEVAEIQGMIEEALSHGFSEMSIPLSMVYIDKSKEESDAVLSGGGLPYCLDDNGWGPANFVTSDCNRAMAVVPQCIDESIIKKPA